MFPHLRDTQVNHMKVDLPDHKTRVKYALLVTKLLRNNIIILLDPLFKQIISLNSVIKMKSICSTGIRTLNSSVQQQGPGGSMSQVVGLSNNSYKPITNPRRICKLQKGCTRLAAASDKVYQLLAHGRWFSPGTPASSTTKSGRHGIADR